MSIRFSQLPGGSGFRWRGRRYRKVSPLEGQDLESGERRLVPRSSKVLPLEHPHTAQESGLPSQDMSVDQAIHGCLVRLRRHLDDVLLTLDSTQRAAIDSALKGAQEDLLHQLEIIDRQNTARPASPGIPDN